jgi:hypothetical protein
VEQSEEFYTERQAKFKALYGQANKRIVMSAGNQHINQYSAVDFQRYHAGQMSPSEMHALEKAALNDPFLQDALEGYLLTPTAEADIAALKKRLPRKGEEAKIIPLTTNYFNRFLKIAAVLVLFAGFSWLIYKNATPGKTELAVLEDTPPTAPPSAITPGAPAVKEPMPETRQESPLIAAKQKTAIKPIPSTPVTPPAPQEQYKDRVITDVEELQIEPAPAVQKEVSTHYNNQSANNAVNGFITDQSGNRLSNAVVRNNANNAVVPVDRNGNFNIVTDDKAPEVTITALGYAKTEVVLRKDTARQQIVLQDNNLESVVVTSDNRAKKTADAQNMAVQKVLAKQLEGKISGIVLGGHDTAVIRNAVPLQGFAAYQAYLATAMKNARETVPPGTVAKVLLGFTVNDAGKAIRIKVKRSFSVLCDNEAVRILRDSPGFTITDKQKPAEIELSF